MVKVQYLGWFSDLPHGRRGAARLRDSRDELTEQEANLAANYLDNGTCIAETTGAILHDELDPERPVIGPFRTLTDGIYIWPSDLPYYVRQYHVAVPAELLSAARHGLPPALSESEVDDVVDALLA